MIARVLRMNADDYQVTRGKASGWGGRGAWRGIVKSPENMLTDFMHNILD